MVAVLSLAACGKNAEQAQVQRAPASSAATTDLMGEWTVTAHYFPGVSALGEADALAWHGRTVRLGASDAESFGDRCDAPTYSARSELTVPYLAEQFRVQPEALPLLHGMERITVLTVRCNGAPWMVLGGTVIRIDETRVLSPWDGVFFELRRTDG